MDRESQLKPVYRHFSTETIHGGFSLEELSGWMTTNLFNLGLVSDMLRKVDMMSMLAGIEVRVPMLDEEVVKLGLQLAHKHKTDGRTGKLVLRQLANQWLPADVVRHKKWGFGIPLDRMLHSGLQEMVKDLLLSPSSRVGFFLDRQQIHCWVNQLQAAYNGHYAGQISRGSLYQRVFMLLSMEIWLRKYNLAW
jgi:asparagine synthase (glutamine-hydrolysing)